MNEDTFLALSLTQSLAEKAIDSISSGGKREVRNALELFHTFFNQLEIEYIPFSRGKYISSFNKSYEGLIKKTVARVRKENLKNVIVNTIYEVFLRGNEVNKASGCNPWIHRVHSVDTMAEEVKACNKNGVYAFQINLNRLMYKETFDIMKAHPRCIFYVHIDKYSNELLNYDYLLDNCVYMASCEAYLRVGDRLRAGKQLFGLAIDANECNIETEMEKIEKFEAAGGIFIAFFNKGAKIDNKIYNELFKIRKTVRLDLAFINLNGLIRSIQRKLME